jgi:hypothetical protein
VSFSVDVAWGDEIASQKPAQPRSVDLIATAPSGIRTIRLRYVVARPIPSGAPLMRRPARAGR